MHPFTNTSCVARLRSSWIQSTANHYHDISLYIYIYHYIIIIIMIVMIILCKMQDRLILGCPRNAWTSGCSWLPANQVVQTCTTPACPEKRWSLIEACSCLSACAVDMGTQWVSISTAIHFIHFQNWRAHSKNPSFLYLQSYNLWSTIYLSVYLSVCLSVYLYILTYLTNNIHGFPWIFPPSPHPLPLLPRFVSRMSAEEDAMVARRALIEILHGMWRSWRWLVGGLPSGNDYRSYWKWP